MLDLLRKMWYNIRGYIYFFFFLRIFIKMNQVYCCCGRFSRISSCCSRWCGSPRGLEVRTRSLTLLLLTQFLLLLLPAAAGVDPRSGSLLLRRNRAYFKGPPPPIAPAPPSSKKIRPEWKSISSRRRNFDQIKKGSSVTIPRLV